MKTAAEIVQSAGMSARPGFYSGRDVSTGDLSPIRHLKPIYRSIKQHHGSEAAAQFVKMVEESTCLAATAFLHDLYRLEGNGWTWSGDGRVIRKSVDPDLRAGSAGGIMQALGGILSGGDQSEEQAKWATESIKAEFFRSIGHAYESLRGSDLWGAGASPYGERGDYDRCAYGPSDYPNDHDPDPGDPYDSDDGGEW